MRSKYKDIPMSKRLIEPQGRKSKENTWSCHSFILCVSKTGKHNLAS